MVPYDGADVRSESPRHVVHQHVIDEKSPKNEDSRKLAFTHYRCYGANFLSIPSPQKYFYFYNMVLLLLPMDANDCIYFLFCPGLFKDDIDRAHVHRRLEDACMLFVH